MFWLPLIFGAAGAAGAIMQANGKKYINQAWLDENFGAHGFAKEFNKQFGALQSSAYGQELLNSAHTQGQEMANQIRAASTQAGFGGPEGVQSGGSLFATSTADQAANSMRRAALGALAQQAAGTTQQYMQNKMNTITQDPGKPTAMGQLGGMLAGAGMMGLQASLSGGGKTTKTDKTVVPEINTPDVTPKWEKPSVLPGGKEAIPRRQEVAPLDRLYPPQRYRNPWASRLMGPTAGTRYVSRIPSASPEAMQGAVDNAWDLSRRWW